MGTSIGIHVILPTIAAKQAISSAKWGGILAVNDTVSLDVARNAGIALRVFRDTATDSMTPSDAAEHLMDHDWTSITHLSLACESGASDSWFWQQETIRILRGRGWTRGIVGGAWATGNPASFDRTTHADGSPHFPALLPFAPVFAAVDYFALHGYVGCLPGSPGWPDALVWYACRHRLYSHCLQQHGIPPPHWIYTERGLDRVQGRTAAGRAGVTADQYAVLALALAAEDAKDGIPLGAHFTLGPTVDWEPFDWADAIQPIAAQLAAYVATQAATPPQSRQDAASGPIAVQTAPAPVVPPLATPAGPAGRKHALSIDNIPEMNQGPTSLCWAETTQEAFAGAGYSVSVYDLYKQVKGVDYVAPGLPATFAELTQCVQVAARLTGATVKWFGADGRVNDFATFDQLLRDGSWVVVPGVNEQALVNDLGLAENAGYGHYFICKHIDFNADGTPDTYTIDSYRAYDHVPVRIPLGAVHDAMRQNWDANYDALAYSVK